MKCELCRPGAAKCRYIQGARLFGNPDANNILAAASIPNNPQTPELAITNDTSSSTDTTMMTLRARFIGQGYKQVIKLKHIHMKCTIVSECKIYLMFVNLNLA